jgi:hypothetical protein
VADIEAIKAAHNRIDHIVDHLGARPIEPECASDDCKQRWPCDAALLLAALDEARADADALRTYARHDQMCNYRPSYPDGPIATCDCGFDAALAAHEAQKEGA